MTDTNTPTAASERRLRDEPEPETNRDRFVYFYTDRMQQRTDAKCRKLCTVLLEDAQWMADKQREGLAHIATLSARAEAAEARAETARSSLQKISEHDIPRPVGEPWAKDGKPSKHDKCTHGNWMWADCDNCTAEFASNTLQGLHPRPAPMAEGER